MSSNTRSVGLNIKRRINEIYSAVAPIKAAADAWNLTGDDSLLPNAEAMRAAIEAFEELEITPLRLFEEIQEIKTGATPPPIAGQVIIGWDNIADKPLTFPSDGSGVPGSIDWAAITNKPTHYQAAETLCDISYLNDLAFRKSLAPGFPLEFSRDTEVTWFNRFPITWEDVTDKPLLSWYGHMHKLADIEPDAQYELELQIMANNLMTSVQILPTMANANDYGFQLCDGSAISRTATKGGIALTNAGCPFGVGDGTTTVNVPTLADPIVGVLRHYMYIGQTL